MSRVKTDPPAPGSGTGAEGDPTVAHAGSVACRSCGTPVSFTELDAGGAATCPNCGAANIAPEEVPADAAD